MVKLTRIYTRGGDKGLTSLGDGSRRPKHDLRMEAIGGVDEANAAIGLARLHASPVAAPMLAVIQNDLFDLGADLCLPGDGEGLRVTSSQARRLETEIDAVNSGLRPLDSFVLPGGSAAAAHLHLARAVVRRVERDVCRLAEAEKINPAIIQYLNRLSDLLFVLARDANDQGREDLLWIPGGAR